MLGTAIASGELILWPYIAAKIGLVFLWAAYVGLLTQYFINMEVERYTLATGETAVTGFTRLWKPWGLIFVLLTALPNIWPAWATGAATFFTFATEWGSVAWLTIFALVAIGIALTVSPVVYQTVEKIETVKITLVLLFLLLATAIATTGEAWGQAGKTFAHVGQFPSQLGVALLLGALAYAGAGGANNLAQSNWIRDKGLGMGARIPRIVSPVTGEEARPSFGYMMRPTEENLKRWQGWWKTANQEQFWIFFFLGAITITVTSVLAYSTVFGQKIGEDYAFIRAEGGAFTDQIAPWFGTLFFALGAATLLGGNLGILDYVGRIIADQLKVTYLRENEYWTESKLYFAVVWTMISIGTIILLSGLEEPLVLAVIAASLSGMVMFVYSILLIIVNRKMLPQQIRIRSYRLVALAWSVALFGVFSILTVIDQVRSLLGGG